MVTCLTTLSWSSHGSVLAEALDSLYTSSVSTDLLVLCQGRNIPVHSLVLAASSPFLARLLQDSPTTLSLDGITYSQVTLSFFHTFPSSLACFQAQLAVQFMYKGVLERLSQLEIQRFLEAVKHLEISGLTEEMLRTQYVADNAMEDDDVFTNDQAVDLSPVNRHPPTPLLSGNLDLATRRMASLNKISQALQRNSDSSSSKSSSSGDQKQSRSSTSSDSRSSFETFRENYPSQDKFLNRIKKPKPLTNLPKPDSDNSAIYLKPRTPRTPLLVSPDCQALEERFRNLIEGNTTDTEKLRNLSVSSADFNFEAGGSLPNTPLRTPRTFNFPPSASTSGTLDLSIKKIGSGTDSDGDTNDKIPTINVIKPEPEEVAEVDGDGGQPQSPPGCFQFVCVKSSPEYQADSQPSPSVKTEPGSFFFPQFSLPFSYSTTPPSPPPYKLKLPLPSASPAPGPAQTELETKDQARVSPTTNRNKKEAAAKQAFKCQKCGKSYNWNYNLNRHMRFECGIQNRFECSMCEKRFPYKQNVAIHLKRKHKLQMDNADDMIAQGHIILLPLEKNEEKS